MSAIGLVLSRGRHRKRWFGRPAPAARQDPGPGLVLAEAADRVMTMTELRQFLAHAEMAAAVAGADLGPLRWRAYVRHTGAARAVSVKIPRS